MARLTFTRLVYFIAFICSSYLIQAQQPWLPREASPAASVSQTIGISTITVNYSRPSIRGREVWGTLVPYGWDKNGSAIGLESPWRAGANENTVLRLSHDAIVEGTKVPAGNYGLTFIINKDNTGEVILSKDYKSWGSFWYNPKQDQMRAKITIRDVPENVEKLYYSFDSVSRTWAELDLNWAKKQFPVKIEFAVDEIVMENAREILNGQTAFYPQNLNAAANYSLAHNVDTAQGMQWVTRVLAGNPQNYTALANKAGFLKNAGDSEAATKLLKESVPLANDGELNAYGYQLLGEKKYTEAIDVLKLNTQKHPENPNTWDSLGEAYALAGDKKNAIANFKKALSMNPGAAVRANSEKYLKQLGAL
jgi:predicted negative regulator of RcsB-dependent stress response